MKVVRSTWTILFEVFPFQTWKSALASSRRYRDPSLSAPDPSSAFNVMHGQEGSVNSIFSSGGLLLRWHLEGYTLRKY